eukprot:s8279_g2.t1
MNGILQNGMVPGAAKSDRSHNYLSTVRLNDASYKSRMRSNQPIEMTSDPIKAMEAGCEFFITETEGVFTRGTIPPSCIINAGEPGPSFRAKRDYEEAASASSAPPPRQAATAPKAVASKKMPKSSPKPTAAPITKLEDVVMDEDDAARKGEPSDAVKADDDEGDTTDAGEEEGYPLGSHPL